MLAANPKTLKIEPDEPIAIISDIHANLEALTAVLADIQRRGIKNIINLGDIIGYGPDPSACIELAKRFNVNLQGNHDLAFAHPGDNSMLGSKLALMSFDWTRTNLYNSSKYDLYLGLMLELPDELILSYGDMQFVMVHGTPHDPLHEYLFPSELEANIIRTEALASNVTISEDEISERIMEQHARNFAQINSYGFVGHTHMPGVLLPDSRFGVPAEPWCKYGLPQGCKTIINPGSVGQPRNNKPNATYCMLHGRNVFFFSVPYDVEATVNKIIQAEIYKGESQLGIDALAFAVNRIRAGI